MKKDKSTKKVIDKTDDLIHDFNFQNKNNKSRRTFLKKITNLGILSISGAWLIKNASAGEIAQSPQKCKIINNKKENLNNNHTDVKNEECATQCSNECQIACEATCDSLCNSECSLYAACPACACDPKDEYLESSHDAACARIWSDRFDRRHPTQQSSKDPGKDTGHILTLHNIRSLGDQLMSNNNTFKSNSNITFTH